MMIFVMPSTFTAISSSISFSLVPRAICGKREIGVNTANAFPLRMSSRISLTPVSACGVPIEKAFNFPAAPSVSLLGSMLKTSASDSASSRDLGSTNEPSFP